MDKIFTRRALLLTLAFWSSYADAASVFGRAVRQDGSSPSGYCRATVLVETAQRGTPEPDLKNTQRNATNFSASLDGHGYFQIVGVPPGRHVLAVECPSGTGVRELRVRAGRDTQIHPPLLLEDLTLDVAVTPNVDPRGRPWQLTIDATVPRLRRIADMKAISADGRWIRHGLAAGSYRVTVRTSDGKPWLQRFFDLNAKSGPLSLLVPFMRVEGRVRLGTQPLRARLTFFNETAGEPAALSSDDNGLFHGLLPVSPGATETSWTVEARSTHPPISRRLVGVNVHSLGEKDAWLELALPLFAVRGTVLSGAGKLQSGVQVTFEDSSGSRAVTATDDAGRFELSDLPPGNYIAVAESLDGVSDRTPLEVAEGVENELKLVLHPTERMPFYVVSSQGPVADAAVQVWIPPGVPRWFTRTDQDGRFDVKLPPGTTEVGLTIGAQGYATKLTRLQIARGSDQSPDANTITLDDSGGTLVLDLRPSGRNLDSSITPYLVHNGAVEAAGTLASWDTNQADGNGQGPPIIEAIEPGAYALCLLADPTELTRLWSGALPPNRCLSGSVEQGETLTLSPP